MSSQQSQSRKPRRRYKAGPKKGLVPYRRQRSMKQHFFQITVVMTALWIYNSYNQPSTHCLDPIDPLCPDRYFITNFTKSRLQFIELAAFIPDTNTYTLPQSDQLSATDIAVIHENSNSDHLVIHISNSANSEGQSGRAIQLAFLEYLVNSSSSQPTHKLFENITFNMQCNVQSDDNSENSDESNNSEDPPIIMLVHALTPYDGVGQDGYHENDGIPNPEYDLEFMAKMSLKLPSSRFVRGVMMSSYYWMSYFKTLYHSKTAGIEVIDDLVSNEIRSISGSNTIIQALSQFLEDEMFKQRHPEWKQQINRISIIDVPSGRGRYGEDTLVVHDGRGGLDGDDGFEKLKTLIPKYHRNKRILRVQREQDFNEQTVRNVVSVIGDLIGNIMNEKDVDILGVDEQFGTLDAVSVFAVVRMHHGMQSAISDYLKSADKEIEIEKALMEIWNITEKRYSDAVFVEAVDWKTKVVQNGMNVLAKIIGR